MRIDRLVSARWIIPVQPRETILEHHSVAVKDGRILEILPTEEADEKYDAVRTSHHPWHALIPGLVNAHTHAAMTLFRGLADDLPLMTWLKEHIWPAEGRWADEAFVSHGTWLAAAEMLRGGVTCFNDMYFFPAAAADVVDEVGMRAVIGLVVVDAPTAWARNAEEYLRKGKRIREIYEGHPRIRMALAPHSPYALSNGPLEEVRDLAEAWDVPLHIHVHESRDEVEESLSDWGVRPLSRLRELGIVSSRMAAAHMVHLTEEEIRLCADAGAHVLHCPQANMKLASGIAPVARLLEAGVNVALGTDGPASNNDLDMFGEMKSAALLAKVTTGDPTALPAWQVLQMATLNGARALGLEGEIGSLEAGKSADMVAVDLSQPETRPVLNPLSQLVYSAGREHVTDVWVRGEPLLEARRLTSMDLGRALEKAEIWRVRIQEEDALHGSGEGELEDG